MHTCVLRRRAEWLADFSSPSLKQISIILAHSKDTMEGELFPLKKEHQLFLYCSCHPRRSELCTPEIYSPLCLKAGWRDLFFSPLLLFCVKINSKLRGKLSKKWKERKKRKTVALVFRDDKSACLCFAQDVIHQQWQSHSFTCDK